MVLSIFFFYTNQNWSWICLFNNNDNGNDIYNDDHINKMEWDFFFSPASFHFWISLDEVNINIWYGYMNEEDEPEPKASDTVNKNQKCV